MSDFPLIEARGAHRELGQQHGAQVRERIRAFLDYLSASLQLGREQLRERALRFLPLFERHAPHLVEEIHGLAEGAGVDFADALALQIRGELGQLPAEGCTTFVISGRGTASGQVLIGQNSDLEPEYDAFAYLLHLQPGDKPALLLWTFGGQLGYHGLNAAGLAHFANALGGGPAWRFALPHYPLKRLMLERRSLDDVFALLQQTPVCSSGNYVLCDGQGHIAAVELTPTGSTRIEDDGAGFLVHTNHFTVGPHACAANHTASTPDSFPRLDRIRERIAARFGTLTVDDLKEILADHEGAPAAICRHPHAEVVHPAMSARARTAAALIAEPAEGRLHVARGNPCSAPFTTYHLRRLPPPRRVYHCRG